MDCPLLPEPIGWGVRNGDGGILPYIWSSEAVARMSCVEGQEPFALYDQTSKIDYEAADVLRTRVDDLAQVPATLSAALARSTITTPAPEPVAWPIICARGGEHVENAPSRCSLGGYHPVGPATHHE